MPRSQQVRCLGFAAFALSVSVRPAWALGDSVVPQTLGLLVGGPVLLALLGGLVWAGTRRPAVVPIAAASAAREGWVGVALLGLLFNTCWFGLLLVFDPGTWGWSGGWSEMGFGLAYVLPSVLLAALWGLASHPRRAGVLLASCLIVGLGHWLFFTVPAEVAYAAERKQEHAQELAAAPDGSRQNPYSEVEEMPEFKGGPDSLKATVERTLKYPAEALARGVEGTVVVHYTVLPDGHLADVQATPGIDAGCQVEAERVVRYLPPFIPGRQHGVAVAVVGTVEVYFQLPAEVVRQRQAQVALKEWQSQ